MWQCNGGAIQRRLFFGDSLTDSGAFYHNSYNAIPQVIGQLQQAYPGATFYDPTNAKFTSAGGKVWAEYLTTALAGKTLQPNNFLNPANAPSSGTNYAQGGAQVNTTPGVGTKPGDLAGTPYANSASPALAALSVKQQVDRYLQDKSGVADPNAVYTVYGGANDIFYLAGFLDAALNRPSEVPRWIAMTGGPTQAIFQKIAAGTAAPGDVLAQSAADLRDQVARLQAAGAKNVIVPLLPDMGRTPAGFSKATTGSILTTLSTGYNKLLQKALGDAGINAIVIDTISLTNDVQSNPAKYGLTNSTNPGCAGLGLESSLLCASMVPGGDTYMFADKVHPTDAVHKMLASYVVSVTDAVTNVAPAIGQAMQQLPLSNGDNIARVIDNHSRSLEGTRNLGGDFRVFMDLSANPTDLDGGDTRPGFNADTANGNVTIGIDMLTSATGFAGFALGRHSYGGKFSGGNARVDGQETSLTFYGKTFAGPAYISLLASLGQIDFNHVDTEFGSGALAASKHGETSGDRKMARIGTGLPLKMGMLTVTPKLDVTHQNLHISGFADNGNGFERMVIEKQDIESTVGAATLELEATLQASGFAIRPYLSGSYNREFQDDTRNVSVSIGSMLTRYRADLPEVDTRYGTVAAGVNFDLSKTTTVGINYAKTLSQNSIDTQHYGMSLSTRF